MNQPAAKTTRPADGRFVIFHLSGMRRGAFEPLRGDTLRIGTEAGSEIQLPTEEPQVAGHHATLHRRPEGYELEALAPQGVWVNGERVERTLLRPGDIIEIGQAGPVLRLRYYPGESKAYKSPAEAFSDCVVTVANLDGSLLSRTAAFVTGVPRELATQTSLRFRALVLLSIAVLAVLLVSQIRRERELEERLATQVTGLAELLNRDRDNALSPEDLALVEAEFSGRIEALEGRSEAAARVIGAASGSVVFLQGAYGYVELSSGLDLRLQLGRDGSPRLHPSGEPVVGVTGEGPPVEALFTGTGFVATADGLLLTNKHVATPWEYDGATAAMRAQGIEPRMRRLLAYLPGRAEPVDVELVLASERADVAVLRCTLEPGAVRHLPLAEGSPKPGAEVFVLGYPAGVRALLARADERFVKELIGGQPIDFWQLAERLAAGGYIAPLATRGIVGQVTDAAVVYDAETTRGGSGGPVIDTEGKVVAVNSAILPEFGGSNLGVPAAYARRLIARAATAAPTGQD